MGSWPGSTFKVRCSSQAWLDFIAGCPPAGLPYIHPDPPRRLRDKSPKTSGRFAPLLVPANARFPWRRSRRRGRSRRRFCADGLPSARRREQAHIHAVAHWEDRQRKSVGDYDRAYENAARETERLLAQAGAQIAPKFLDFY